MNKTYATLLGSIALISIAHAELPADATEPKGELNVNLAMVRQGVAPRLNWKIEYPTNITDVVDIDPDDEIDPKTKLRLKVRMVGVGITDQFNVFYPAKTKIKFGSSKWQNLFTGTTLNVRPNKVLVDRIINPGEKIKFSAKVNLPGYKTYKNNSRNIKVLKNGDTPPSVAAGYSHQTSVAAYLRPYVKNGKISLGPMDLIYVSELTHSTPGHFGYDMQDAIVLLQFERVKSNN